MSNVIQLSSTKPLPKIDIRAIAVRLMDAMETEEGVMGCVRVIEEHDKREYNVFKLERK